MGATLKDRPVESLTVSELVLRYFAYIQHSRAEEHQQLRDAFERALAIESDHALGWACLGFFYEQELARQMSLFRSLRDDPRFQETLREMNAGPA